MGQISLRPLSIFCHEPEGYELCYMLMTYGSLLTDLMAETGSTQPCGQSITDECQTQPGKVHGDSLGPRERQPRPPHYTGRLTTDSPNCRAPGIQDTTKSMFHPIDRTPHNKNGHKN